MINIYIGVSRETFVPAAVLRQSIKKTSNDVRVFDCPALNVPNINIKASTPFSFNRLAIPLHEHFEECDWAIYLDSDMLVLNDIQGIIQEASNEDFISIVKHPFAKKQTSVSVFNVKQFREEEYLDSILDLIQKANNVDEVLLGLNCNPCISSRWNSLDFISENTGIAHFTFMPTQPWVYKNSPYYNYYRSLINELLEEDQSFVKVLAAAISSGYVHPSLGLKLSGERKGQSQRIFVPYFLEFSSNRFVRLIAQAVRRFLYIS